MTGSQEIDGVLVQWGERLFYPANRMVRGGGSPKFRGASLKDRAAWVRARIAATAARRAPQVMVKITGGGRGMAAIAAHLRYISKGGRLQAETETGEIVAGKDAVRDLAEEWRIGGSLIEAESNRRDALNVMLSMPRGTDPLAVQRAAREFAKLEFADHKYVMVLHDHQANPHVHISVRRESKYGQRINPRRRTFSAGGRHSPRSCASGVSRLRLRDRLPAVSTDTTRRSGRSRRRRRGDCGICEAGVQKERGLALRTKTPNRLGAASRLRWPHPATRAIDSSHRRCTAC